MALSRRRFVIPSEARDPYSTDAAGRLQGVPTIANANQGLRRFFPRGHFATTVVEIPPRGRKSPFTSAHTGFAQRTTSSSTRFTMFS